MAGRPVKRLRPLLIAIQFLTRLPVRLTEPPDEPELGRSLLYYPLVGVIIGALLVGLAWLLQNAPPQLGAALILSGWVWMTGGLHLDGLADSADAWVGGLGNRERTLAIMKDPSCGPAGVTALVLVILVKFAALTAILQGHLGSAPLLAPIMGRAAPLGLFATTAYVRSGGIGSALAHNLSRRHAVYILLAVAVATVLLFGVPGIAALIATSLVFAALRRMMLARIGGMTGDTAGALVELTECAVLVIVFLASGSAPI